MEAYQHTDEISVRGITPESGTREGGNDSMSELLCPVTSVCGNSESSLESQGWVLGGGIERYGCIEWEV